MIDPAAFRPEDLLRFVQIDPFPGQWAGFKLSDSDLQSLELSIMSAPHSGKVIRGAGGLRKVRFSPPGTGMGKRGAYRVFYVYFQPYGLVALWAIIAKDRDANLSKADRDALGRQIGRLQSLLDKGMIR